MRSSTTASTGCRPGSAACLAEAIAQLAGEAPEEMLVVPVPLHASKYAQRGFNQSRSLARAALRFLRKSHPAVAAHAGFEHSPAPARHREPGRTYTASAAHQCPRRIRGLRSRARDGAARFGRRRHFDDGSHGARRGPGAGRGRRGIGLGGHAGACAARRGKRIFRHGGRNSARRRIAGGGIARSKFQHDRAGNAGFLACHLFSPGGERCRWERP